MRDGLAFEFHESDVSVPQYRRALPYQSFVTWCMRQMGTTYLGFASLTAGQVLRERKTCLTLKGCLDVNKFKAVCSAVLCGAHIESPIQQPYCEA